MMGKGYGLALATFIVGWIALTIPVYGASLDNEPGIPHIDKAGHEGYRAFGESATHRAFAIAPGGAWTWTSGSPTPEAAESEALRACREFTDQPCHLFAVDHQVVFDKAAWNASWNLHISAERASTAPVGTGRGHQFPDLALTAPDGQPVVLSDLRGQAVFLHFWGSWCPPCQIEMPDVQRLLDALVIESNFSFVMVQSREAVSKSRRWAKKRAFTMPLYDSGHRTRAEASFRLADGSQLDDRRLAPVYPTTYILDANGLVVFRHAGPGEQWQQYEKLIRNLAANQPR